VVTTACEGRMIPGHLPDWFNRGAGGSNPDSRPTFRPAWLFNFCVQMTRCTCTCFFMKSVLQYFSIDFQISKTKKLCQAIPECFVFFIAARLPSCIQTLWFWSVFRGTQGTSHHSRLLVMHQSRHIWIIFFAFWNVRVWTRCKFLAYNAMHHFEASFCSSSQTKQNGRFCNLLLVLVCCLLYYVLHQKVCFLIWAWVRHRVVQFGWICFLFFDFDSNTTHMLHLYSILVRGDIACERSHDSSPARRSSKARVAGGSLDSGLPSRQLFLVVQLLCTDDRCTCTWFYMKSVLNIFQ
jgi:hypothetical protein